MRLSLVASLVLAASVAGAAPVSLVQQGRLVDADDKVLIAPVDLTFSLHALETDPSTDPPAPLWSKLYEHVNVSSGLYAVTLAGAGSVGGVLDTSHFAGGGPVYLQVKVGATSLVPRLRVGVVPSAAFATEAGNAQKLDGKTIEELKQVFSGKEALDALKQTGTINAAGNPVDWSQLKNVPPTIIEGVPPVGAGATLSGNGATTPLNVVYGTTAGTAAQGNDGRFQQATDAIAGVAASLADYVKTSALTTTLNTALAGYVKREATGAVKVGNDTSDCTTDNAGAIRFVNGAFQGCTGAQWANLNAVPPTVTSIQPLAGSINGGATVTIRGTNFTLPMQVSIGGASCTGVALQSGTQLTCVTPSTGTQGKRDVRVEVADGSSASLANAFTYVQTVFDFTGGPQTFVVPPGVTAINVDVEGAQGARSPSNQSAGAAGGLGGRVTASIPVTPGETLSVYVGGQGSGRSSGGYNGGGEGGDYSAWNPGAQGGGASDLRRSGTSFADRIVVAGGGGGGGFDAAPAVGGAGGGLTGGNGTAHNGDANSYGRGGTQGSGGAAGTYTSYTTSGGGLLGIGGSAPSANTTSDNSGGGGGGGYYGGGAGTWGGGGGGSSYVVSTASSITHFQGTRLGNGRVQITF